MKEITIKRDPEEVVDFEFEDDGSLVIYERYLYIPNGIFGSVRLSPKELNLLKNFIKNYDKSN